MPTRIYVPYQLPTETGLSRHAIEALAQSAIADTGIAFDPSEDSKGMMRALGGTLESCFEGDLDLDVRAHGDFKVHYSFVDPAFENLGIARQLGHYLLHYPGVMKSHPGHGMQVVRGFKHAAFAPSDTCQREAEWFANAIVMPEDQFRKAWDLGGYAQCHQTFWRNHGIQIVRRAKMLGLAVQAAA
ncbi:ImmA/IrrE family metallo-endopeptidase [Loktanella sp. DJP18]|uniref:ImmA/IrrE family metallo-endopeptidase n=1 Tax=Loktanella sp. DJP18 TaxID=3409788 RepID=UPI003BB50F5C